MTSQAEAVIARFGNARDLARAMAEAHEYHPRVIARDPATIYKWTYPRHRGGTGGYIPSSAVDDVKVAARVAGIVIRAEDWAQGGVAEAPRERMDLAATDNEQEDIFA